METIVMIYAAATRDLPTRNVRKPHKGWGYVNKLKQFGAEMQCGRMFAK